MKILTCGSSPLSGSRNAERQRCQSSEQLLEFFRLCAIQMISCHNWWPWTKPGHITTTRRQSNNERSGGIAAHPFPLQKSPSAEIRSKSSRLPRYFGIKTTSSSFIIFQKAKLSTWSITHLCWCNWRTFWRKVTNVVLFLHDNAPAHRTLTTQKKLTYLCFQCLDHPPYSPELAPSDYHLLPGLKKQFFIWHGGHCCRRDLVGRTTFWFFFWVACRSWSNGLRSVLSFVGSMLNKSRVWSL